jgi:molybdate transport system substrate-binding protein
MQSASIRRNLLAGIVCALLVLLAIALAACGSATGSGSTATSGATTTAAPVATAPPTTAAPTSTTAARTTTSAAPQPLLVSAASSLKGAFTEIGKAFDQGNNAKTTFNFDASGTLQKQIEGGAPVDVFASAAPKQVKALLDKNLVDSASVKTFASNEIVLVVPANSTLGITSFEDLAKATVKKVTYGDPKVAPHGVAAEEILNKIGLLDKVKPNVIYAANVSQALEYVSRGEVDAGLIFASEAKTGGDKIKVAATSDPGWHSPIAYVMATISASKVKTLAQAFVDFVAGADGQAILQTYGFLSPPAK